MSQTIDSRVVEMKFDNSNFESNVSQSLSTLDKLKASLKFDGATDGLKNVSDAAKNVDVSSIGDSVEQVGVKFSAFQVVATTALANITNSAVNVGKSIVSSITSAIGSGGLTRALNIEQAQFMFEGLGMDVEKVMANCNDAVTDTAYSLDAAAMAAAQFGASGMQAGDEMTSALRAIAGVAAMTGSEYSDIANIFTTVAGNGRLMGDQLLQLSYRGMNAAATLADYLGKSESEVRSMVSAGQIDFETFYKAMDEAFGQHAKDANQTFTGALANMKAAAARIGADFYTPVLESSKNLFNAITPVVNAIRTGLAPAITGITGIIDKVFNKTISWLNALSGSKINSFFSELYDRFKLSATASRQLQYTLGGLESVLDIVGKAFSAVINVAGELASFVVPAILSITGPIGRVISYVDTFVRKWNVFGNIGNAIVSVLGNIKSAFGDIWKALTGKFNIFPLFDKFFSSLNKFIGSFDSNIFKTIADTIGSAIDGIKNAIVSFINFIPTDFIGSVISAPIKLIGGLLSSLGINFTSIATVIKSITSIIGRSINTVKEWVQAFTQMPAVQNAISNIGGALKTTGTNISKYFSGGIEKVKEFIESIKNLDSFSFSNLGDIFKKFKDDVLGYFLNIGDCFGNLGDSIKNFAGNIKEYFANATDSVGKFINKILEIASSIREKLSDNFGLGEVLTVGLGASLIVLINKIGKAFGSVSTILGRVETSFGSTFFNINKILKSTSRALDSFVAKNISKSIKNLAVSIAILAASLIALAQVDSDKLKTAGIALVSLAGGLTVIAAAMAGINKLGGGNIANASVFVGLAASVLILTVALKQLNSLDSDSLGVNLAILGAVLGSLGLVAAVLSKYAPELSSGAITIVALAAGVKILVSALDSLTKIQANGNLVSSIVALVGIMTSLALVSKLAGSSMSLSSGAGLVAMVLAINLLVGAIKNIAKIKTSDVSGNIEAMVGIFAAIVVLMASCRLAGENATKAGVGLLAISAALVLIGVAIKNIGGIDSGVADNALSVIKQVGVIFAALIVVSKFAGKNASSAGAMLLLMSGALLVLSGVILILSHLDPSGLDQAVKAIEQLELCFAVLVAASGLANSKAKATITMLAVCVALLATALGALAMINADNLKSATTSLSAVIGVFSLLVASTALMGSGAKKANSTLIVLTGIVAALAIVVSKLASVPFESSIGAVASLSVLLLSLTAAVTILSKAGSASAQSYASIAFMTLIVGGLALIIGLLSSCNVGSSLEPAAAISVLLLSMSAAIVILGTINSVSVEAMGALVILTGVVAVLAIIIGNLSELNPGSALTAVQSLSTLLIALSAALVLLEVAGLAGPAALVGIGSLVVLVGAIGGMMVALGALSEHFPKMEEFLDEGLPLLNKIAEGIGSFFGNIVGGFVGGVAASSLGGIGQGLTDFMDNISGFLDGARGIDDSVVSGVKSLAEAVLLISGAEFLEGITSFLSGGDAFLKLGTQLVLLGDALTGFGESISDISNMSKIKDAAEASRDLGELLEALPTEGGLLSKITGSKMDLGEFGSNLETYGDALTSFSESLDGFTYTDGIKNAVEATKDLAEMAEAIPNSGGFFGEFFGDNDIGDFGAQLETYGDALTNFSGSLDDFTYTDGIKNAVEATKDLAEMAKAIPNSGGFFGEFFGDNNISDFGTDLVSFGVSLSAFSLSVSGLGDCEGIRKAAEAGVALANMASEIPDSGKLFGFFGESDLMSFSVDLVAFGNAMLNFSKSTADISGDSFNGAVEAAKALSELTGLEFPDFASNGLEALITGETDLSGLKKLGKALKDYYKEVNGIDTTQLIGSTNGIKDLANAMRGIDSIDTGNIDNFVESLNKLGKVSVDSFVESINGSSSSITSAVDKLMSQFTKGFSSSSVKNSISSALTSAIQSGLSKATSSSSSFRSAGVTIATNLASGISSKSSQVTKSISSMMTSAANEVKKKNSSFKTAGSTLMNNLVTGMKSRSSSVKTAASSAATSAASGARSARTSFYNAGTYLVQGFAQGISSHKSLATSAATKVGQAASTALNKSIKSNSPSRVTIQSGSYFSQGFAIGIERYAVAAYSAAKEVGSMAVNGLNIAIAKISDAVNNDIAVNSVITPVLDLSNVENGARRIPDLLGGNQSLGLAMNSAGYISNSMNSRNDVDTMGELLSAIRGLNRTLSNQEPRTVNNINGVTYDDGTGISDAVETLVHAAKIGRRA